MILPTGDIDAKGKTPDVRYGFDTTTLLYAGRKTGWDITMPHVPAGTAYAVWMGLAMTDGIVTEELFLRVPLRPLRVAFVLITVAEVLRPKRTSAG
jgi:multidrug transporter EmrE-like cation transporter